MEIIKITKSNMIHWKEIELGKGKTFQTSEGGNSMSPKIKNKQEHILASIEWKDCNIDDIVFCKVSGKYYTHLVLAKDDKRGLLIGNNKGGINGWTTNIFGKVIKIL